MVLNSFYVAIQHKKNFKPQRRKEPYTVTATKVKLGQYPFILPVQIRLIRVLIIYYSTRITRIKRICTDNFFSALPQCSTPIK
jgi:hypothetical protein